MTVYVCDEKDIECGSNPSNWCDKCPQWASVKTLSEANTGLAAKCGVCGASGLHACVGFPMPKITEEQKAKLAQVFKKFETVASVDSPVAYVESDVVGFKLPKADYQVNAMSLEVLRKDSETLNKIRKFINDPNQDGVLAKIREALK